MRFRFLMPALAMAVVAACQAGPNATKTDKELRPGQPTQVGAAEHWDAQGEIKAAEGGTVVSPDGKIKAVIPPGAFDRDTTVKIEWLDTSAYGYEMKHRANPGILFRFDPGTAVIQRDKQVLITARAHELMVPKLKERDANFSPEKYNLSQNDQGEWFMTMPVYGIRSEPLPARPFDFLMAEQNIQWMPGDKDRRLPADMLATMVEAEKRGYKVLAPTVTQADITSTCSAPFWAEEGANPGTYRCDIPSCEGDGRHAGSCVIGYLCHSTMSYADAKETCYECGSPPPTPNPTAVRTISHYTSDEPALNGQRTKVVLVYYDGPSNADLLTVSDDQGVAVCNYDPSDYIVVHSGIRLSAPGPIHGPTLQSQTVVDYVTAGNPDINLYIPKNMPVLNFSAEGQGGTAGDHEVKFTRNIDGDPQGDDLLTNPGLEKVSIYPATDYGLIEIKAHNKRIDKIWTDVEPTAATTSPGVVAFWHDTTPFPYKAWYNSYVAPIYKYVSNDDAVPSDQRPASQWNGKTANNLDTVVHSHSVSSAPNKPGGRKEAGTLTNVNSGTEVWGLRDASGSVKADITLPPGGGPALTTGTQSYTLSGVERTYTIPANLPRLTIPVQGELPHIPLIMTYHLDNGPEKKMNLPAPSGSNFVVNLPVEDPLNQPELHTLKVVRIASIDEKYQIMTQNFDYNFPAMVNLRREQSYTYPQLRGILVDAKYRIRR